MGWSVAVADVVLAIVQCDESGCETKFQPTDHVTAERQARQHRAWHQLQWDTEQAEWDDDQGRTQVSQPTTEGGEQHHQPTT